MFKHYAQQVADGFSWKIVCSICATAVTTIEGFYSNLLWGFLSLFVLDLITGILKSKHNHIPISSKRLRDSVVKLGSYMVLITSIIVASKYEPSFVPVVTLVYYYFMFTELKSIVENAEEMGVKIPAALSSKINDEIKKGD